ncbi:MAG: tetratricopeptide repeat protein [Acidobacteria bacterium]|nr:tetratricopeptide repeat protein [Acidobacteriota bacterium]
MADNPRLDDLKRRVQLDPASIAFAALAEEFRRAGQFEEAVATCKAGLQRHPAYLSARVTLGRALIETGQFDEARDELEHVLRLAPENLAAIRGLADIHHRRGELPEALEQYRSALDVAQTAASAPEVVATPTTVVITEAVTTETTVRFSEAVAPPTPAPAPAADVIAPHAFEIPITLTASPPPDPPGLAGLEQFLAAILRARAESRRAPVATAR